MKSMSWKPEWTFALIPVVFVLFWGCFAEKQDTMTDKQKYDAVTLGLAREEVERILGEPVTEVGNKSYYGKPPKIEKWQSPIAPGAILIEYSDANLVQFKRFYGIE